MNNIKYLFTQNKNLRTHNIYAWTLPALGAILTNGDHFKTCPQAGQCAKFCYARNGTYMFKTTKKAHLAKLEAVLYHREDWLLAINAELDKKKYPNKFIRIHDSGDMINEGYYKDWISVANNHPLITFYFYTKEVKLVKDNQALLPSNMISIFSYGGKQDYMIDRVTDRNCDVFGSMQELLSSGYALMEDNDSFAATSPNHCIGIYRNNITHFAKKQGNKSFSQLQDDNNIKKNIN